MHAVRGSGKPDLLIRCYHLHVLSDYLLLVLVIYNELSFVHEEVFDLNSV